MAAAKLYLDRASAEVVQPLGAPNPRPIGAHLAAHVLGRKGVLQGFAADDFRALAAVLGVQGLGGPAFRAFGRLGIGRAVDPLLGAAPHARYRQVGDRPPPPAHWRASGRGNSAISTCTRTGRET